MSSPGTSANAEDIVRVERTFDAPAESVFDAWTNPEVLRRWWASQQGWRSPHAEVDLRVGGRYRLSMEDPAAGSLYTVRGAYREITRPERLVYSWAWEGDDGSVGPESTVTVQFHSHGDRTTVVLEHSGLETPQSREGHRAGWEGCMQSLAGRVFAPPPTAP